MANLITIYSIGQQLHVKMANNQSVQNNKKSFKNKLKTNRFRINRGKHLPTNTTKVDFFQVNLGKRQLAMTHLTQSTCNKKFISLLLFLCPSPLCLTVIFP